MYPKIARLEKKVMYYFIRENRRKCNAFYKLRIRHRKTDLLMTANLILLNSGAKPDRTGIATEVQYQK